MGMVLGCSLSILGYWWGLSVKNVWEQDKRSGSVDALGRKMEGDAEQGRHVVIVQIFEDVHYSNCPKHVRTSLLQARRSNRNSRVVLLGGERCRRDTEQIGVEFYLAQDFWPTHEETLEYRAKNNEDHYRIVQNTLCLKRWLVLRSFMKAHNIEWVMYLDSDTMLYMDVGSLHEQPELRGCDIALAKDGHLPLPPAFAFVRLRALEDFCRFALSCTHHLRTTPNDMRLWAWYAYVQSAQNKPGVDRIPPGLNENAILPDIIRGVIPTPGYPVCSLSNTSNGYVFDKNLKFGEETVEMLTVQGGQRGRIKQLLIIDNLETRTRLPYLVPINSTVPVSVAGLHFQGDKKPAMEHFLTHPGNSPSCLSHFLIRRLHGHMKRSSVCRCKNLECRNCLPLCDRPRPSTIFRVGHKRN